MNLAITSAFAKAVFVWAMTSFPALAQTTVTLNPVADGSLFQALSATPETGTLASGSGEWIFVGVIPRWGNSIRRGLVRFDLGAIPPGSTVTSAQLIMHFDRGQAGTAQVNLHRVTASWGEGASSSFGGQGASAGSNDATWLYRYFGTTQLWGAPGGDFEPIQSASTSVPDNPGDYAWTGAQLQADVQGWVNLPATNFGWLLDAPTAGAAMAFDSRESSTAANRPRLVLTYTNPAPMSDGDVPLPIWAIALLGLACARLVQQHRAP